MKIGIITWFGGGNYGTNLQAIALQGYLRKLGYSVQLLNFEIEAPKKEKLSFLQKIKRQPQKYAIKYALKKYKTQIETRYQKMKAEIQRNCVFTEKITSEQNYIDVCNKCDILICGSDQIWNPNWYHRFYYADYDQIQSRIISYAPSMGVNAIEKKGVALLKSLSLQEPAVVVDPTLLLDAKDWNAIFPTQKPCEEKYILSMFLTDNASHWRAAQIFAKSTGLKQIVIPYCGFSYFQNAEIKVDTGIQDFLNLIRGAEYILTDSFHVTVFSLIYRKQFYTFERFKEDAFSSQNERIRNILEIANVSDRLVPYGTNRIDFKNDIKYNAVVDTLNIEIEKSKVFLYKAIGNCK